MTVRGVWTAIVVTAAGAWACGDSPLEPTMLGGTWGGDHLSMTIADWTHLEFDCAHGDIAAPIATDSGGRFNVIGTFTREHGGPVRVERRTHDAHDSSDRQWRDNRHVRTKARHLGSRCEVSVSNAMSFTLKKESGPS